MNGTQPFVYITSCGDVFSQAGLRTVSSALSTTRVDKETYPDLPGKEFDVCPQCATKFDMAEDLVLLNPSAEEEERMRTAMDRRRLSEPAKKSKKRKHTTNGALDAELPAKKKPLSHSAFPKPSTNPNIAAASRAVVSSLAVEEAKRKAGMSDAVKSLYSSEDGPKRKETFMTMGTFTRVSKFYCDIFICTNEL
jgi:ribosome-binding protein aMBF1 (putative translation factor)